MKTLENANNSGGRGKCQCQCQCSIVLVLGLDSENCSEHFELTKRKLNKKEFPACCFSAFPALEERSILISRQALWQGRFRGALI